jgi:serine/threonine protein phosphatase PrpC
LAHAFAYATDKRQRKENQDQIAAFRVGPYTLIAVCDGMGGHVGGAQAAALAIRTLHDVFGRQVDAAGAPGALKVSIEHANQAIYEAARKNYRLMGMGTTIVAAVLDGDTLHVAHVGDSRAYLVRGEEVTCLTRDHTMVNLFVDAELLSPEDAATHPEAHVLSRSLGVERSVDVDVHPPLITQTGDRFILCSDGVHGVLTDDEFGFLDFRGDPSKGVSEAMAFVAERDGDDNASIVALVFGRTAGMPETQPPDLSEFDEAGRNAADEVQSVARAGNAQVSRPLDADEPGAPETTDAEPTAPGGVRKAPTPAPAPAVTRPRPPELTTPASPASPARKTDPRIYAAAALVAVLGGGGLWYMRQTPAARRPEAPTVVVSGEPTAPPAPAADPGVPEVLTGLPPTPADPGAGSGSGSPDGAGSGEPSGSAEPTGSAGTAAIAEPGTAAADPNASGAAAEAEATDEPAANDGLAAAGDATLDPFFDATANCLDCGAGFSRVLGVLTAMHRAPEAPKLSFFAPSVPPAPSRSPHRPTVYRQPTPRGPEQLAAVQAARAGDCSRSLGVIDEAMKISKDFGSLYLQAWTCFDDSHQKALLSARAESPAEFILLEEHFRGSVDLNATWTAPPTDGVAYRLLAYADESPSNLFDDAIVDLIGEPAVADKLGTDLVLEAYAAAAHARIPSPSPDDVRTWARHVFVTALLQQGRVGALIQRHRPDLNQLITALLEEAAGAASPPAEVNAAYNAARSGSARVTLTPPTSDGPEPITALPGATPGAPGAPPTALTPVPTPPPKRSSTTRAVAKKLPKAGEKPPTTPAEPVPPEDLRIRVWRRGHDTPQQ